MNVTFETPEGCVHRAHIHHFPTFEDVSAMGPEAESLHMGECTECGFISGQMSFSASDRTEALPRCERCGLTDGTHLTVVLS